MSKTLYACITQDPSHAHTIHSTADKVHIARAAFQKNALWPQNADIKIHFMRDSNYTEKRAKWTETVISKYIEPIVNLKFHWDVSQNDSNVRISFDKSKGAFSYVGNQAESISKDQITMNLGWTDQDPESSDAAKGVSGTGVVVVHEFGHLLGMIHEHQRGDAPFHWNKAVVYAAMQQMDGWNHAQVDAQIFQPVSMDTLNASKFDPHSVMEYIFPNNYFTTPPDLAQTRYLSNLDIVWMNKMYPGKSLPDGMSPSGVGPNPFGGSTASGKTGTGGIGSGGSGNWLNKNWYWILIAVIVLAVVIYAVTTTGWFIYI
jgi:hypothetical protein